MAFEDFPEVLKGFVLITLFIFLIAGCIFFFANQYNKDTTELNQQIQLESVNQTLTNTKSLADTWKQVFSQTNVFSAFAVMVVGGAFNLFNTMASFFLAPFKILSAIMINVLGIPSILIDIIYFLIVLTIIFGIWKIIRTGGT